MLTERLGRSGREVVPGRAAMGGRQTATPMSLALPLPRASGSADPRDRYLRGSKGLRGEHRANKRQMLTAEVALAVEHVHWHVEHPRIAELRLKPLQLDGTIIFGE